MALYVASHYKNSPNDLQLMADAPAHHLFVLLGISCACWSYILDLQVSLFNQICLLGDIICRPRWWIKEPSSWYSLCSPGRPFVAKLLLNLSLILIHVTMPAFARFGFYFSILLWKDLLKWSLNPLQSCMWDFLVFNIVLLYSLALKWVWRATVKTMGTFSDLLIAVVLRLLKKTICISVDGYNFLFLHCCWAKLWDALGPLCPFLRFVKVLNLELHYILFRS